MVDDEQAIGMALRRALGRQHDVQVTTRAAEALQWITEGQRFDVILCDLLMPDMSGMDFYARLGQLAPDLLERVIFVTGGAFTARSRAFIDSVPNARMEKPFDLPGLRAVIHQRLG